MNECKDDVERFEKSTQLRKVKNFAWEAVREKIISKKKQVGEMKFTSDLFRRLLYLTCFERVAHLLKVKEGHTCQAGKFLNREDRFFVLHVRHNSCQWFFPP